MMIVKIVSQQIQGCIVALKELYCLVPVDFIQCNFNRCLFYFYNFFDLFYFWLIDPNQLYNYFHTLLKPNMLIRSRKKFSTTYAIVLFFCFFFSRPFHENFKFLRNCLYDFHEILHSHSTPKGAPACAKTSKSYGWDVRNIAKISPKMAKKQPYFDFFRFSQKLSIRFERNFLQLFYTILESYMCNGIKIVWLGCEKHSQN